MAMYSSGYATLDLGEQTTNLVELALVPIRHFYDFLVTPTEGWSVKDFERRAPIREDDKLPFPARLGSAFYAQLIREVLLPARRDGVCTGSPLQDAEILYGLVSADNALSGKNSKLLSNEPRVIFLCFPIQIRSESGRSLTVFKQVSFRPTYTDVKASACVIKDVIFVNGILVVGGVSDPYWALKPHHLKTDLWWRLGLRPPKPSVEYVSLDLATNLIGRESNEPLELCKGSMGEHNKGSEARNIVVSDEDLKAALGAVDEFYRHLVMGTPPEHCPNVFAVRSATIEKLCGDDSVRVWKLFQEMRESIDIGVTEYLTKRDTTETERLEEYIRLFWWVVLPYQPHQSSPSRRFYIVFTTRGAGQVKDPCLGLIIGQVWIPVARFDDGFRIIYNELMVNGIPIYQMGFTELPPSVELWRALGFPTDPEEMRRARVKLTRFRVEDEDRFDGDCP